MSFHLKDKAVDRTEEGRTERQWKTPTGRQVAIVNWVVEHLNNILFSLSGTWSLRFDYNRLL